MTSRNQAAIVEIFHGRTLEEMKWDRLPACHGRYGRLEAHPPSILLSMQTAVEATCIAYSYIMEVPAADLDYITSPV